MPTRKRRLPMSATPANGAKRSRTEVIDLSNEEEPLEAILAQIQAQDESEVLARQLQDEWNNVPSASGSNDGKIEREAVTIDDEDDEALARRLAKEWEELDKNTSKGESSAAASHAGSSRSKDKGRSTSGSDVPTSRLREDETLFTGGKTCSCGADIPSSRGFVAYTNQVPPPSLLSLLHAPCKSCKKNFCRGCLKPVSCPLKCRGWDKGCACPVATCCAEVRAIALFEALGGFDRQYLEERATSDARAKDAAAKRKSATAASVGPGGTGYAMGHASTPMAYPSAPSRGRGRGKRATNTKSVDSGSVSDQLASHWEEVIVRALMTITEFLPSPYSDAAQVYDMLPHASMAPLLCASQLPDLLGNLLRNDSVTDWTARSDVYDAMLRLLRRLADCELTIEVLIGQRYEMTGSCGLEEWMWRNGDITWAEKKGERGPAKLVRAPPLYAHFAKLTKQCETFLSGASSMFESENDEDEVAETMIKATSLCGDIIAARDDIERAMRVMGKEPSALLHEADVLEPPGPSSRKSKGIDASIALEKTYTNACNRLSFAHVALFAPSADGKGLVYPTFNFAKEVAHTVFATRNPKDRLHLIKELAVIATSLPPGVWMRVDEVRNDVIKIMIAGPEGTPYAGGLFEFDCFLPIEYPHKPPLVHLRTTGGGKVRFNPNLYNDGKVCLSLLGTWPGTPEEQWSPKSTLLQVLVSIQSMILVELPYFNEPGYGKAKPSSQASINYNRNISMQTVRWGMVEWLKDEHKDGIWADVIASHFTIRNVKIRKCILEWAKAEPGIRSHSVASSVPSYGPYSVTTVVPAKPGPSGSSFLSQAGQDLYAGAASLLQKVSPLAPGIMDLVAEYDKGIERIQKWKDHSKQ